MKLVTLIFENVLKDEIQRLVDESGATGYTIVRAEGKGSRGVRADEFQGTSYKLQTIVNESISDVILAKVAESYFEDFSLIAWEADVNVIRGEKFGASRGDAC